MYESHPRGPDIDLVVRKTHTCKHTCTLSMSQLSPSITLLSWARKVLFKQPQPLPYTTIHGPRYRLGSHDICTNYTTMISTAASTTHMIVATELRCVDDPHCCLHKSQLPFEAALKDSRCIHHTPPHFTIAYVFLGSDVNKWMP